MRAYLTSVAVAVIALGATLGSSGLSPTYAEGQPSQQNAAPEPEKGTNPSAPSGDSNRKHSGTNDQAGPSNAVPTTSQDGQGDKATHSVSGRSGKEEPGSHAPSQADAAVFVNGKLNVPGAPADSQTVPAKFSARNDKIDNTPIMAMSLGLSDEQKRAIAEAVGRANTPVSQISSKPSEELPWDVTIHDLPNVTTDPTLPDVKYVRTPGGILLVRPSNRVVVGEIKG
jgi:hypothetical protein